MKKLIALLLCISMLTLSASAFTFEIVDPGKAFSEEADQAEAVSDWALAEVEAAKRLGLVVPSCTSYMTGNITREQFAELSANLVEVVTGKALAPADVSTFTDCTNEAVRKAAAAGIVNGVGNGLFAPNDGLTREQLAAMLYRAWTCIGGAAPAAGLEGYTDANSVSAWAADAVGALAASGIMKGTSNTTLTPQGPCTIEQSVLLIYRLYQQAATTQTSENPVIPSDAITIDMRNPGSHREPREGDTVIRPDGTSVILKRDAETGVLGWGQNVGCYLGTYLQAADRTVTAVEFVSDSMKEGSIQEELAGGRYMRFGIRGYEYSYYWEAEWDRIKEATYPDYMGEDGEVSENQLWMYFRMNGGWLWLGPDRDDWDRLYQSTT